MQNSVVCLIWLIEQYVLHKPIKTDECSQQYKVIMYFCFLYGQAVDAEMNAQELFLTAECCNPKQQHYDNTFVLPTECIMTPCIHQLGIMMGYLLD